MKHSRAWRRILDGRHFLLEIDAGECAALMNAFFIVDIGVFPWSLVFPFDGLCGPTPIITQRNQAQWSKSAANGLIESTTCDALTSIHRIVKYSILFRVVLYARSS